MQNLQHNSAPLDHWLKKSISLISVTGITTLLGLPVLSQAYYPPMVFFQPLAHINYPYRGECRDLKKSRDLFHCLQDNTSFKNLVNEIEIAGLTEKLQQEHLTVLAPSDNAFNSLPDEVFDKFSEPENRRKVLQYHLILGEVTEKDIERGEITTLAGETIAVSSDDNNLKLNDAQAVFPSTVAKNGVIIEIERVLLPPGF